MPRGIIYWKETNAIDGYPRSLEMPEGVPYVNEQIPSANTDTIGEYR